MHTGSRLPGSCVSHRSLHPPCLALGSAVVSGSWGPSTALDRLACLPRPLSPLFSIFAFAQTCSGTLPRSLGYTRAAFQPVFPVRAPRHSYVSAGCVFVSCRQRPVLLHLPAYPGDLAEHPLPRWPECTQQVWRGHPCPRTRRSVGAAV